MSKFAGRVAVVTGAGSGMGRTLSLELARRGAKLAISDVDADGLATTARLAGQLGAEVKTDRLDVSERETVVAYADSAAEHYGVVNQVCNNAGIAFNGTVAAMDFKDIENVMDVDFWGVVNGTKSFLPHLIASGDGHVINTSSLFGILAMPNQSAYNSAKFAVRGFTEALRLEMLIAGYKVRVSCVHPGGVKTSVADNAGHAGDLDVDAIAKTYNEKLLKMSPEKAATIILDGVAKNKPRILVGNDAKALDILVRLTGSKYQRLVLRGMDKTMR